MEPMSVRELLAATGGTLLGTHENQDLDAVITAVELDSRAVDTGALFVALRGEQTDGHRYIASAMANGGSGCLVEDDPGEYVPGKFYIQVPSTLEAVGHVAKAYKEKFDIPVIGVTGSVGKTTTKEVVQLCYRHLFIVAKNRDCKTCNLYFFTLQPALLSELLARLHHLEQWY